MLRDRAIIMATVCSAVLSVLPAGVFITTMPCRVAAALSMLSVPTPARTIAFRRLLPASDSAVILTPLRTIAPSNCARDSRSSSPASLVRISYSMPGAAANRSSPSWAKGSRTITRYIGMASVGEGGEVPDGLSVLPRSARGFGTARASWAQAMDRQPFSR